MKKYLVIFLIGLTSCEKYVTNVSDLTISGKYVVSKLVVIETNNPNQGDTTYLSNQIFINNSLPDPFDSIKVNDFYLHFDYSRVRIGLIGTNLGREIWKYGDSPNYIFYNRVPWTFDAYTLGKISFEYVPMYRNSISRVVLQVDSDLLESIQLSGFEFISDNRLGTKKRLVFSLTRVGP